MDLRGLLFLVIAFALYFLPSIIAVSRHKSNAVAIGVFNLFLGWTFLGWVISLVWACTAEKPTNTIVNQMYMNPGQFPYGQPNQPTYMQPGQPQYNQQPTGGYPASQGYLGQPVQQNYYQPQPGQSGQFYPTNQGLPPIDQPQNGPASDRH